MSPLSVAAIILAAGRSSRMGRPKALLPTGPTTILGRLVETYRRAGLERIVVVASGPVEAEAMRLVCARVIRGDPGAPMVDSVSRALASLQPGTEAAFVQPVDAPFTSVALIEALLAGEPRRPRVPAYRGTAGHPVLLPASYFAKVEPHIDGGLRRLIANEVELVPWENERVLADLDTPDDLDHYAHALQEDPK